jgi:tetraacyldisaccharide 4'-kinase
MKAPAFWWRAPGLARALLWPAARVYASAVRKRAFAPPGHISPLPVICIGNVTAGGSGKTPIVLSIVKRLQELGHAPHILSRGYGGEAAGPLKVDPAQHTAQTVGDEARMMAAHAPVWVGADRAASARCAEQDGASALVMDDGFQNPGLGKSFSVLVFDGLRGIGNGATLPAGPLREPLADALARAGAAVILGTDVTGLAPRLADRLPVLHAELCAVPIVLPARVFGFCGIGNPEKFRRTLRGLDTRLVGFESFADHHRFSAKTLARLDAKARALDAVLATTEKDAARIGHGLPEGTAVVRVEVAWSDRAALDRLLAESGCGHA